MYPVSNKRLDKALLILSAMSPDMVDDIFQLFSSRGRGVIAEISADARNSEVPQFLGIFSDAYIGAADFKDVWIGFGTVVLGEMRKPDFSNDRWENYVKSAYSLPSSMAAAVAKRVETSDILSSVKDDAALWETIANKLANAARQAMNWSASVLQLPYEIDANQKYDVDFLYELSLFGKAIRELNERARLMNAQAKIAVGMNSMMTGDPGTDPQDAADMYVGDVMGRVSTRVLPASVMGGMGPLASLGRSATAAEAVQIVRDSGYNVSGPNTVTSGRPRNSFVKKAVDKILNLSPGKSIAIGASLGLLPNAVSLVSDLIKNRQKGDPDLYGDIAADIGDMYGDTIADCWAQGDIDGIAKAVLQDAHNTVTTGDPDLDAALDAEAFGDIEDDLSDLDPEVGGLFTRFRTNNMRRRAARRRRKATKRGARQLNRRQRQDNFDAARRELNAADTVTPSEEDMAPLEMDQEMAPDDGEYTDNNEAWGAASGFDFPS